jgi:L-alanine-DL-glutamate epimerase-like enolase superfamily enzyme
MPARIAAVECWIVTLPRDVPYLGPAGPGDRVTPGGYLVRAGNRTVYPTVDRSVLVRLSADDGSVGWGETYGIVAPRAVTEIVTDVLGPQLLGRDPREPAVIHEDLYDLMRVRNGSGGLWGDALAALDIAVWDLLGHQTGLSLAQLLGGRRHACLPAYASGLPGATLDDRVRLALGLQARGFDAVKYAAVVSQEGIVEEMAALRGALGPKARLMVDLHWKFGAAQALALAQRLAPFDPLFIEAPCAPEDLDGQARVGAASPVPVALGEEWHSVHEALPRFERRAMAIVQPEMAHTGVTEFAQIGRLAQAFHLQVMPHATIGVGLFLAASLQTAAALPCTTMHEYQHSVFDRHLPLLRTTMRCEAGAYTVPEGPGIGAEPAPALWAHAQPAGRAA